MAYPTHEQERKYARSKIPQSNFQTKTAAAANNFKEYLVKDKNLTNVQVLTEDNADESTGHFGPTDEYKTVNETTVTKELAVGADEFGRDLLLATGSVTTTQPNAGAAPAVRQHVFKMQDLTVSKQGPAMTLLEFVGGALNRAIPSLVVEDFSMKGQGVSRLMATMGLRGSGLVVEPSGLDADDITAVTNRHYFTHVMVQLVVADSVTLANADDFAAGGNFLSSWSVGLKRNLLADEGYIPGAGLYFTAGDENSGAIRGELLTQSYQWMMDFQGRLLANSKALAALRSKKKLDVQIDIVGPQIGATTFDYKLSIHAPRVSYETVELPSGNGMYQVSIKPKIFFDTASDSDVEITLVNDTTSYTV